MSSNKRIYYLISCVSKLIADCERLMMQDRASEHEYRHEFVLGPIKAFMEELKKATLPERLIIIREMVHDLQTKYRLRSNPEMYDFLVVVLVNGANFLEILTETLEMSIDEDLLVTDIEFYLILQKCIRLRKKLAYDKLIDIVNNAIRTMEPTAILSDYLRETAAVMCLRNIQAKRVFFGDSHIQSFLNSPRPIANVIPMMKMFSAIAMSESPAILDRLFSSGIVSKTLDYLLQLPEDIPDSGFYDAAANMLLYLSSHPSYVPLLLNMNAAQKLQVICHQNHHPALYLTMINFTAAAPIHYKHRCIIYDLIDAILDTDPYDLFHFNISQAYAILTSLMRKNVGIEIICANQQLVTKTVKQCIAIVKRDDIDFIRNATYMLPFLREAIACFAIIDEQHLDALVRLLPRVSSIYYPDNTLIRSELSPCAGSILHLLVKNYGKGVYSLENMSLDNIYMQRHLIPARNVTREERRATFKSYSIISQLYYSDWQRDINDAVRYIRSVTNVLPQITESNGESVLGILEEMSIRTRRLHNNDMFLLGRCFAPMLLRIVHLITSSQNASNSAELHLLVENICISRGTNNPAFSADIPTIGMHALNQAHSLRLLAGCCQYDEDTTLGPWLLQLFPVLFQTPDNRQDMWVALSQLYIEVTKNAKSSFSSEIVNREYIERLFQLASTVLRTNGEFVNNVGIILIQLASHPAHKQRLHEMQILAWLENSKLLFRHPPYYMAYILLQGRGHKPPLFLSLYQYQLFGLEVFKEYVSSVMHRKKIKHTSVIQCITSICDNDYYNPTIMLNHTLFRIITNSHIEHIPITIFRHDSTSVAMYLNTLIIFRKMIQVIPCVDEYITIDYYGRRPVVRSLLIAWNFTELNPERYLSIRQELKEIASILNVSLERASSYLRYYDIVEEM